MHTYRYIHTYTYIGIRTYYTHTCIHTYTHTHNAIHTYTHTYMHACRQAITHAYIQAYMHTSILWRVVIRVDRVRHTGRIKNITSPRHIQCGVCMPTGGFHNTENTTGPTLQCIVCVFGMCVSIRCFFNAHDLVTSALLFVTCDNTYIHTYTHIHTYRHTYAQTCIHTYIQTHKHTNKPSYIHTHTHRYRDWHTHPIHTDIHTYIDT